MTSLKTKLHSYFKKTGYQIQPFYTLNDFIKQGKYKWLEEYKINTLFDVGANVGEFSKLLKQILPNSKIFCFEPIKDCQLELNKLKEKYSDIEIFNFGIGETEKEINLYKNKFNPSSSILKLNKLHTEAFPYTSEYSEEKIKIISLDSIFAKLNIKKNILLKIDVQGFELEVLKGAKESLSQIKLIIVELSTEVLYENQPLFNEVYKYLTDRAFKYCGNYDQMVDPRNGKILQVDAIFVNQKIEE